MCVFANVSKSGTKPKHTYAKLNLERLEPLDALSILTLPHKIIIKCSAQFKSLFCVSSFKCAVASSNLLLVFSTLALLYTVLQSFVVHLIIKTQRLTMLWISDANAVVDFISHCDTSRYFNLLCFPVSSLVITFWHFNHEAIHRSIRFKRNFQYCLDSLN